MSFKNVLKGPVCSVAIFTDYARGLLNKSIIRNDLN
jgi:hypothetical protein